MPRLASKKKTQNSKASCCPVGKLFCRRGHKESRKEETAFLRCFHRALGYVRVGDARPCIEKQARLLPVLAVPAEERRQL